MRAALSVLGIVAGLVAAAFAIVASGPFMPLLAFLLLATIGVLALLARGAYAVPVGIAAILLGVLALLYFNPIGNENRTYLADLPPYFDMAWLTALCLAGAGLVLWTNRAAWGADWVGWGGLGAAALGILLTLLVNPESFGGASGPMNWLLALCAVAAAVACGLLLREPAPDPAPPSAAGTTRRAHR